MILAIAGTFYDWFVYQKVLKESAPKSESEVFDAQSSTILFYLHIKFYEKTFQLHLQKFALHFRFTRMGNEFSI